MNLVIDTRPISEAILHWASNFPVATALIILLGLLIAALVYRFMRSMGETPLEALMIAQLMGFIALGAGLLFQSTHARIEAKKQSMAAMSSSHDAPITSNKEHPESVIKLG